MSGHSTLAADGAAVASAGVRFGVKGSDAAALLQHHGLRIPAQPNRVTFWLPDDPWGSGRCLRQGGSEFLIELDSFEQPALLSPEESFPNAWTLIRSDHSQLLSGDSWPHDLAQLCSFDFARLQDEPDLVVMTLMAGISVTLIREPATASADFALRLWCDAGFSTYLQDCLNTIRGIR
jgi:sarcosine oxidase subunit gamma